MITDLETLLN
jgi:hypothetical protein